MKKGMSLVEVIVSMAILIIITVTTMSLTMSAVSVANDSALKFKCVNDIRDVYEIYKATDDIKDFQELLDSCYKRPTKIKNNGVYVFDNETYRVEISIMQGYFSADGYINRNNNKVYTFEYHKRGYYD